MCGKTVGQCIGKGKKKKKKVKNYYFIKKKIYYRLSNADILIINIVK